MKRHIIYKAVCIFVMMLCCVGAKAQDLTLPSPPEPGIPRLHDDFSPQVSMMQRYGTYPVDLSTGMVDISIPLYTIRTPQLELPLGISFHPSGLKANEREGLLGVRWVLTGGGMVTRSVRGYSDMDYRDFNGNVYDPEYNPNFYDLFGTQGANSVYDEDPNPQFISGSNYNGLYIAPGKYKDTEYDIFSYSLPNGKNGKFLLNTYNEDSVYTGTFLMPYTPIKIRYDKSPSRISITDEDGTVFVFGENTCLDSNSEGIITAWHLTSILSADRKDVVQFDYVRNGESVLSSEKYLRVSGNCLSTVSIPGIDATICDTPLDSYFLGELLCRNYFKEGFIPENFSFRYTYLIKKIRATSNGIPVCDIDFIYENDSYLNAGYLQEMQVKDASGNIVKDYRFTLRQNVYGREFLDELSIINPWTGQRIGSHTFEYYNQDGMYDLETLRKDSDWWGFYSNGGGWMNTTVVSTKTPYGIEQRSLGSGDKQPRPESAKTGMIKSITYPTGGRTTFEYEGNTFGSNQELVGGLRIKRLINEASSGRKEIKSYEYGKGYTPHYLKIPAKGYIKDEHPVECYFQQTCNASYEWTDYLSTVYQCSFPSKYTEFNSNISTYETVTEYVGDKDGNTLGKTVYSYSIPYYTRYSSREYYITTTQSEFTSDTGFQVPHITPEDCWEKPQLLSKVHYKGDGRVKEWRYEYKTFDKGEIYDLPVYRHKVYFIHEVPSAGSDRSDSHELYFINEGDAINKVFAFVHQKYTSGAQRLAKETVNTYADDGSVHTVEKAYTYDSVYLLPISETVTNSDSTDMCTGYVYPFSTRYNYLDVYEAMVKSNMLNSIIEKNILAGSEFYCERTEYANFDDSFRPCSFTCYDFGIKTEYHQYSVNGKPVYVTRNDGGEKTVYLWSYCGQYPIAEIRNVTYEEVCDAIGGEENLLDLNDKTVPSNTDYAVIRNVYNLLPHARIVTAKYRPLVGMTEYVDEKGMTTRYEYDETGRLTRTYMKEGYKEYTLEKNEYNYINR